MILILISKIVFALSLLGILFIVGRKLPALSGLSEGSLSDRFSLRSIFISFGDLIRQVVAGGFFQKIILGNLEKSLRRFKIMTLRIHNFSDKFIRKIKKNEPM